MNNITFSDKTERYHHFPPFFIYPVFHLPSKITQFHICQKNTIFDISAQICHFVKNTIFVIFRKREKSPFFTRLREMTKSLISLNL